MKTQIIFLTLFLAATMCAPFTVNAQVTIGSGDAPQKFSVLELISNQAGLRLPQIESTAERDRLFTNNPKFRSNQLAWGLQIFNMEIQCVETWNGWKWASLCVGETPPAPPRPPHPNSLPSNCAVTASNGSNGLFTTFTVIEDPNAVFYEFFVDGVSQGLQRGNVLTLSEGVSASAVTFHYIFSESFLRPSFEERMVRVQGGTFRYGSGTQAAINPTHVLDNHAGISITLPTFYIANTPVTQAQFEAVMGFNPALFQCVSPIDGVYNILNMPSSVRPVERVSWFDAIAFANKLSALEGRDIFYQVAGMSREDWLNLTFADITEWNVTLPSNPQANNGYRLPTEIEWEFAARGGMLSNSIRTGVANSDYFFSNGNDGNNVWHSDNPNTNNRTHPVGQFAPNVLGLYDMSGNVWEWCWEWSDSTEANRVVRGASWNNTANSTRVSNRGFSHPNNRGRMIGFRLVAHSVE